MKSSKVFLLALYAEACAFCSALLVKHFYLVYHYDGILRKEVLPMRFKQVLVAVSVCAVTMVPAISHAEDVGPVRSSIQSFRANIQDFFAQFLPESSGGSASDGSIFSANSNGNSLNLNYNEDAAQSVGDQFDEGFDQIGAAFSDIF